MSSKTEEDVEDDGVMDLLTSFAENTTMHGVARVGSPDRHPCTRLFWLLFVLGFAGFACYNVQSVLSNYWSYPVSTLVTLRYDEQIEFPAITICNLNQLRFTEYEVHKVEIDKLDVLQNFFVEIATSFPSTFTFPTTSTSTSTSTQSTSTPTTSTTTPTTSTTTPTTSTTTPTTSTTTPTTSTTTSTTSTTPPTTSTTPPTTSTSTSSTSTSAPPQTTSSLTTNPWFTFMIPDFTFFGPESSTTASLATNSTTASTSTSTSSTSVATDARLSTSSTTYQEPTSTATVSTTTATEPTPPPTTTLADAWTTTSYQSTFSVEVEESVILREQREKANIRAFMESMPAHDRFHYGHQLTRMLIDCNYQRGFNCSHKNFTQFFNHYFGNCYTFNKEILVPYVSKPGPMHGLSLLLNVESDQYLPTSDTVGLKVVIHNRHTMPFPEDGGIVVSPGFATNIGIVRKDLQRSPPPYGKCKVYSKQENLEKNMYAMPPFEVGYSDKACQRTCYQRSVVERCGCCDPDYPCMWQGPSVSDSEVSSCLSIYQIPCLRKVMAEMENNKLSCDKECLPNCEETVFTEEVSMGTWPSSKSKEELRLKFKNLPKDEQNYTDMEYIRNNVVKLNIFYKQLNYERIETSPAYDWYRLLSDLGGQLGLWLGFSLLTAMEFIELGLLIIKNIFSTVHQTGHKIGRSLSRNSKENGSSV